jgi:hypothetical protein
MLDVASYIDGHPDMFQGAGEHFTDPEHMALCYLVIAFPLIF